MKRTITIALFAFALAASGCAAEESGVSDDTATTTSASTDTSPTTTVATETTAAQESTTTTTEPPESGDTSELAELLETLEANADIVSGRMEGVFEMTGLDVAEAGLSEISMVFSTAFDAESGNSSFIMDLSSLQGAIGSDPDDPFAGLAAGLAGTMEFRQIDDRVFVNSPFFGLMFGAETEWISMPAEDGAEFSSGFETVPSDPTEVIDAYDGADASVENLGAESVNGTEATHYRITFDTSAWIDQLSADERAELEASGVFADGALPMDLWITAEGYLVRMIVEIDGSMAESPSGEFETMTLRYDLFDINGDVTISEPPASDVTAIEDLDFLDFDLNLDA